MRSVSSDYLSYYFEVAQSVVLDLTVRAPRLPAGLIQIFMRSVCRHAMMFYKYNDVSQKINWNYYVPLVMFLK